MGRKYSTNLLVVSLWIFAVAFVASDLSLQTLSKSKALLFIAEIGVSLTFVTCPFFGWLADTKYGRYKVIRVTLYFQWWMSVFYCLSIVLLQLLSAYGKLHAFQEKQHIMHVVWYIVSAAGLGGVLANIVHFAIDQLPDGSSTNIVRLIRWFVIIVFLSNSLVNLMNYCLTNSYVVVRSLLVSFVLSVALLLDQFCSASLVKEPTFENPLIKILKVLKYAMKNKYPHLRGAYSYWNSSYCSRIEFAKSEYGGPFAADLVEDTKAFLRIVSVLVFWCLFSSLIVFIIALQRKLRHFYHHIDESGNIIDPQFIADYLATYSGTFALIFLILVFELFPCRRLKLYLYNTPVLKRALFGSILIQLSVGCSGILYLVSHLLTQHNHHGNNATCLLNGIEGQDKKILINYKWVLIPNTLQYLGFYLLWITATEFICSQSPYSMKGLLYGLLFEFIGVFCALNYSWQYPFEKYIWNSQLSLQVGCETVYLFCIFVLMALSTACFCIAYKFYKPRERNYSNRVEEIVGVDCNPKVRALNSSLA